jgi:hypothetical protein
MQVSNVKYYTDLNFADYLALPGVSYSSIKGFEGPANAGMSLGTKVHQYLLEPSKYVWEDVAMVQKIAHALRTFLGSAITVLDKEVAFTADFTHNGVTMSYKGRADLLKAGRVVVDLKVLSGALTPSITRFGYAEQLSGYCIATDSPMALIAAYNRASKKVEHKIIKPSSEWWAYQTVARCQIPTY